MRGAHERTLIIGQRAAVDHAVLHVVGHGARQRIVERRAEPVVNLLRIGQILIPLGSFGAVGPQAHGAEGARTVRAGVLAVLGVEAPADAAAVLVFGPAGDHCLLVGLASGVEVFLHSGSLVHADQRQDDPLRVVGVGIAETVSSPIAVAVVVALVVVPFGHVAGIGAPAGIAFGNTQVSVDEHVHRMSLRPVAVGRFVRAVLIGIPEGAAVGIHEILDQLLVDLVGMGGPVLPISGFELLGRIHHLFAVVFVVHLAGSQQGRRGGKR